MADADLELQELPAPDLLRDPTASAEAAGLRYTCDDRPGIRRRRCGQGFCYYTPDGTLIRDPSERRRIDALAIPPAWKDVWICPSPRGHLQATGRDARGRKQYRYHDQWIELRSELKYERLLAFGRILPEIRRRTDADLAKRGLVRERVLALVVRLLERSLIRIGSPEYVRENRSYGLTTLRRRHVAVSGSRLYFAFRGKSGMEHEITVADRRLARLVKRLLEIPGQTLFYYLDQEDRPQSIESEDVNIYLSEITGEDFTAKDFRTWRGTVHAASALLSLGPAATERGAKRNITAAVKETAHVLGNRPAVCRRYYIHPAVLDGYRDGALFAAAAAADTGPPELDAEERMLLRFLEAGVAPSFAEPPLPCS
jgi:DNA topoisomerase-1